jgi:predicted  nucleic acid-binding Zn-ribbon protein
MDEKLANLEINLSTLSKEFLSLKEAIAAGFKKVDTNFASIGSRLASLEKQVKELNFKVANLDTNTSSGLNEVGTKIESLTEEINKISVVTKYDEMCKNQQGLSN